MMDDKLLTKRKPSSPSVEAAGPPTEAEAPYSSKGVPVLPHFRAPGQFRRGKRYWSRSLKIRKVWVSIINKILVCKIWFKPPPPKRAQNEEKLYKSVEYPQK